MKITNRLLSAVMAAALALPMSVSASAAWDTDALNLARYTGARNDSYYGDGNPWTIARRAIVVREDDSKHSMGKFDFEVYQNYPDNGQPNPNYDAGKDPDGTGKYWYYGALAGDPYNSHDEANDTVTPGTKLYLSLNPFWTYDAGNFPSQNDLQLDPIPGSAIREGLSILDNDDLSVKVAKGENGKYIKSVKILDKQFYTPDIEFVSDSQVNGLPGYGPTQDEFQRPDKGAPSDRNYYMEIELKDSVVDKEYPVTFKLTIKAKKDIDVSGAWYDAWYGNIPADAFWSPQKFAGGTVIPAGTKITVESDRLWVNNKLLEGDQELSAGDRGIMIKPTKNDDNEMVWSNGNGTIAKATFLGSSGTDKFYAKLSTKWDFDTYDEMVGDTDAFIYDFSAKPSMSSVSRATMELRNPFVNSDGDEIIAPEDIIIYQLDQDGEAMDVTKDFVYKPDADEGPVFQSKNRIFGTYIFSADPLAMAAAKDEANKPVRFQTGIILPEAA